ncbi:MAG: 4Fe-4S dicluster domain-containing protein [Marinilabiliaceae bacterium]|jgi:ferredoxin|nr:4Fe-4S dicluster domain-containing protein [Marinilabiliaceae bacterium]
MMKRDMVKIDEDLCTGCGDCVPNCHEGALQIIDGKAVLISDLMCDGLGASLGHCPEGAITIEKREAEPYNETKVMEIMVGKTFNTLVAHLSHLKDHGEEAFLAEGIDYLKKNANSIEHDVNEIIKRLMNNTEENTHVHQHAHAHDNKGPGCGCQSSAPQEFRRADSPSAGMDEASALTHWPVQMHLINPAAGYFKNSDLLIAADCSAFTLGAFHSRFIKGKTVVIACPKLDQNTEIYVEKFRSLIDDARVNTITLLLMEVPCCGGLLTMLQQAMSMAERKVPVKLIIAGIQGDILREEWI